MHEIAKGLNVSDYRRKVLPDATQSAFLKHRGNAIRIDQGSRLPHAKAADPLVPPSGIEPEFHA